MRGAESFDRVCSEGHDEGGGKRLGVVTADYQFAVLCSRQTDQDSVVAAEVQA